VGKYFSLLETKKVSISKAEKFCGVGNTDGEPVQRNAFSRQQGTGGGLIIVSDIGANVFYCISEDVIKMIISM
jgi:hypothetical protein